MLIAHDLTCFLSFHLPCSKHICLKTRQSWCFTQGLRGHRHVVTDSLRSFSIISGTSDFPPPLHLVLKRLPNYRSRARDQHETRKGQRETPHSGEASGVPLGIIRNLQACAQSDCEVSLKRRELLLGLSKERPPIALMNRSWSNRKGLRSNDASELQSEPGPSAFDLAGVSLARSRVS